MFDPNQIGGPAAPEPEQGPSDPVDFDGITAEISRLLSKLTQLDGTVTPIEREIVAKVDALIAKMGATRYKEDQAALGGGPATNSLSRILGGV